MRITWFGHSAFKLQFGDVGILFDPFITGSGYAGSMQDVVRGVTHLILTHGHSDHVGDAVQIVEQTGATVIANAEIAQWMAEQGAKKVEAMNTGGSIRLNGLTVTLTSAFHSSGLLINGVWAQMGHPNGVIIEAAGEPTVYHLGDTGLFGDMKLINEIYQPKIGFVPIGDRYTMGARTAAYAVNNFFDFDVVVPCHYGTFPQLAQNADDFVHQVTNPKTRVIVPEKGEAFEA